MFFINILNLLVDNRTKIAVIKKIFHQDQFYIIIKLK